jgi:hypothetical protein
MSEKRPGPFMVAVAVEVAAAAGRKWRREAAADRRRGKRTGQGAAKRSCVGRDK